MNILNNERFAQLFCLWRFSLRLQLFETKVEVLESKRKYLNAFLQ